MDVKQPLKRLITAQVTKEEPIESHHQTSNKYCSPVTKIQKSSTNIDDDYPKTKDRNKDGLDGECINSNRYDNIYGNNYGNESLTNKKFSKGPEVKDTLVSQGGGKPNQTKRMTTHTCPIYDNENCVKNNCCKNLIDSENNYYPKRTSNSQAASVTSDYYRSSVGHRNSLSKQHRTKSTTSGVNNRRSFCRFLGFYRRSQNYLSYLCFYAVAALLLTGLMKEYLRVQELEMIVEGCVLEKYSVNSQIDILYDQRMSLKSLIDREREINAKTFEEYNKQKTVLGTKQAKCASMLSKERAKIVRLTQLRAEEIQKCKAGKRDLKTNLTARFKQELNSKTTSLSASLQKYKSDAVSLKEKLKVLVETSQKMQEHIQMLENKNQNLEIAIVEVEQKLAKKSQLDLKPTGNNNRNIVEDSMV